LTYYDVTVVFLRCFDSILHILIIETKFLFICSSYIATDVFLNSFIIVSTHRLRHVASETGFKQDSLNPNPDSDSIIECTFLLNPALGSLCIGIRKVSHINVPGLRHVNMLTSSTMMSPVNVSLTVSPYVLGGGLTTGTSDVSC